MRTRRSCRCGAPPPSKDAPRSAGSPSPGGWAGIPLARLRLSGRRRWPEGSTTVACVSTAVPAASPAGPSTAIGVRQESVSREIARSSYKTVHQTLVPSVRSAARVCERSSPRAPARMPSPSAGRGGAWRWGVRRRSETVANPRTASRHPGGTLAALSRPPCGLSGRDRDGSWCLSVMTALPPACASATNPAGRRRAVSAVNHDWRADDLYVDRAISGDRTITRGHDVVTDS